MPEHIDSRGQDNPSQYVVEDRNSNPEMIRLMAPVLQSLRHDLGSSKIQAPP